MAHTFAGSHALGALQQVAGALRESATTLTFDPAGTYATGGIPITAANVGLSSILFMIPAVFDNGYYGVYVNATGKIKVFSAAGTELANASAALQSAKALLQASGT